jgi:tRNA(fMet)-specific endonuclease VapC
MALKPVVLDTTAVSHLIDDQRPEHPTASRGLERVGAELPPKSVIVSALVVYEVRRGLIAVGADKRRLRFEQLLRAFAFIANFDEPSADTAASLWAKRKASGQLAGEIDLMILAAAIALGADVVTEDNGFPSAPGVTLMRWADVVSRR